MGLCAAKEKGAAALLHGVVVGDVGRILGENVAHDLIDGIIALLLE